MSALLESNAVQEDIQHQAQFQEITSVVSHQYSNEICCVCQTSILSDFLKSSLLALY